MLVARPIFLNLVTSAPRGAGALLRIEAEYVEREEEPARTLVRLAQPSARLTLAQARASGLTNRELDDAPPLDEALQDLLEFSEGGGAWIVPDGEAARGALELAAVAAGFPRGFGPAVLGVDELGAIVLPTVCQRGVAELVTHYGLESSRHNSPALLRGLWTRLEAGLLGLPLPVLAEMNWLLNRAQHPLKALLKEAEKRAVETQFAGTFASGKLSMDKLFQDFSEIIKQLKPKEDERLEEDLEAPPAQPVDPHEVRRLLGPGGPLARALPAYEERAEQLNVAARVAEALSAGKHLLAEAGTGVGKSLAYLVPAVLFARANERPVIVSTHTKNLQAQLFHKDLPLVREALGLEFKAALLKGRPNYLCARKFMYTLQESAHELDDTERAALLPVMAWAAQTQDGDVAELSAFSREEHPALWERLHTVGEDCLRRQCPFFQRCFVYKARGLARAAEVVVVNHALVFSDLNTESGTLPPYSEIVFDEAHTLEDVATEHLACEITARRAFRVLQKLFRAPRGSSAGKGLLPTLLFLLEQAGTGFKPELKASIREHGLAAIQAVEPAAAGVEDFFAALLAWFESGAAPADGPAEAFVPRERGRAPRSAPDAARAGPRGAGRPREDRRRFSHKDLRPDEREAIVAAKERAVAGLGRLRQALQQLSGDYPELKGHDVPRARELEKELSAQDLFLQELIGDWEFLARGDEPNYVYWVERLGRTALRMVAAPLDISRILHSQLYDRKRSVILTSATFSVRDAYAGDEAGLAPLKVGPAGASAIRHPPSALGLPHKKSFEFVKQRLGLALLPGERLDELLEGSPFDYARQCRLYVPTFLPDPGGGGERDFNAALAALIAPLAAVSGGRAMALYTSYFALKQNAEALRKALAPEGIEVLAQGEDGSREALLARLKAGGRVILLGTSSFWEGVDVAGEALSLLVIAKLPFQAFKDPLVEGRCELLESQGKDPFLHFSVPHAILRLRQGFGRLIRSKTDRGVVVLCDKRVLTKRYGAAFLRALPAAPHPAASASALAGDVREFLGASG